MIELTEQQQQALHQEDPLRVVDPRTQKTYVLVRSEIYEQLSTKRDSHSAEICRDIPEGIRESQEAFWNDLPNLLTNGTLQGSWVAYHRKVRIGIARDPLQLRLEIRCRGIPRGEYYFAVIRPREIPPWEVEEIEPVHSHHFQENE
jgi:hypothetical protein